MSRLRESDAEAAIDIEDNILYAQPAVLRRLADALDAGRTGHVVITDPLSGDTDRFEVVPFDPAEWGAEE